MPLHVMLDLETWGKGPTAQIVSIGAVKFDPEISDGPFDNFHVAVTPDFGTKLFRKQFDVDPGTVMWWMSKDRTLAREHWLDCQKLDLPSAMVGFLEWFGPGSLPTWGNGATFDNVIMLHAIASCGFERPWTYRDDRCYRTLSREWPEVPFVSKREAAEMLVSAPVNGLDVDGIPHTALYDAQVQAIHMRRIYVAKAAAARYAAALKQAAAQGYGPVQGLLVERRVDGAGHGSVHVPGEAHEPAFVEEIEPAEPRDFDTREAALVEALRPEPRSGDMLDMADRVRGREHASQLYGDED